MGPLAFAADPDAEAERIALHVLEVLDDELDGKNALKRDAQRFLRLGEIRLFE